MREILFKAKRVDNGEWVEGDLFHSEQRETTEIWGTHGNNVVPKTVCQYTGLVDKNGVKIFEGDILKYRRKTTEETVIEFRGTSFVCPVKTSVNCTTYYSVSQFIEKYNTEVIGNIHNESEENQNAID